MQTNANGEHSPIVFVYLYLEEKSISSVSRKCPCYVMGCIFMRSDEHKHKLLHRNVSSTLMFVAASCRHTETVKITTVGNKGLF